MSTTITIPKSVTHGDELIIVRREEYEGMHKHLKEMGIALTKGSSEKTMGSRYPPEADCYSSRFQSGPSPCLLSKTKRGVQSKVFFIVIGITSCRKTYLDDLFNAN